MRLRIEAKTKLTKMKRSLAKFDKEFDAFRDKAVRAKQINDGNMLAQLKRDMKNTAGMKQRMERTLLAFERMLQMGEMADVVGEFMSGMKSVTDLINLNFSKANVAGTLTKFGMAQERLSMFQDEIGEAVDSIESLGDAETDGDISDAAIDAMIEDAAMDAERGQVDDKINASLERARRLMKNDQ